MVGPRRGNVLVVEDDDDVRDGLRDILEEEGYRVWTAANGQEALDRLSALSPQLILLDLMMPVMNGVEFLSILRQHKTLSATPVVVVSAWSKEARSIAVQGFLAKPVALDALLSVVQRFCSP
jgi:two-component system, OmpR family, response regulator CpxR